MLKKIFSLVILLQISVFANSFKTNSELDNVKVYLSGVELSHKASVNLNELGRQTIIIEGLASSINERSLQVKGLGNFTILSVKSRPNYLTDDRKTKEIIDLENQKEKLVNEKNGFISDNEILNSEIELLNDNRKISPNSKLSLKDLENFSKYYRKRLSEIKNSISVNDEKIKSLNEKIAKIDKQLNTATRNKPLNEVVVEVIVNKKGKASFEITYLSYSAGWNPSYNVRVKDINSNVELSLLANLWQNTGLNWEEKNIALSTLNPRDASSKPVLHTWYLDFVRDYFRKEMKSGYSNARVQELTADQALPAAAEMEDFIEVHESQLSFEFVTDIKYSIPSDRDNHIVLLKNYNLDAEFKYYAAPKYSNHAYLVAYLKDWKKENLMPGNASIYFENTFVGETYIDAYKIDNKLSISLGKDKSIVVKREVLKDFTEDKFLSSDIERMFGYSIDITNNKSKSVSLIIEEQIPISKNENIEVDLQNNGGGKLNSKNGILSWELDLDSGKSKNYKYNYSVRYPSDKKINNL